MENGLGKAGDQMSENEIKMLEYERKEQDFLHFINQIRREKDRPVTPDQPVPRTLQSKGIHCLLALTRLLEETVKMKLVEINSEKDLEDLIELRKQAERMGQTDHKHFHFYSPTYNLEGGNNSDDPSIGEDHKISGIPARNTLDLDQHDHHKTKSLRVGTQMLSDTIGKVKTKFLKTSGTNRESVVSDNRKNNSIMATNSGSVFPQRKLKSNDYERQPRGISSLVHASSNELLNIAGNNPSPHTVENEFEKITLIRQQSEAVRSTQCTPAAQPTDRFVSLPDNLEKMVETVTKREKSLAVPKKGVLSHQTSYEEAILSARTPTLNPTPHHSSKFNSIPSETEELTMTTTGNDDYHKELELARNNANSTHFSKEFAKKFERWVTKTKLDNKENPSKHASNQARVKGTKKKGKAFNRQRSMSADRVGLLAGESNIDFEEKLRQWGIKQAHDPDYYLGSSRRRSRNEERSVESPARLSRRDAETTTFTRQQFAEKTTVDERVGTSAILLHHPASIERGRRVSPSRLKHYTSRTSQSSLKSSSDGISSSSSSGSVDPINQLSPSGSISGNQLGQLRAGSVESLLSTDESMDLEDEPIPKRRENRPLSMVAMPGSLDSSEPTSPPSYTDQWRSESDLVHSSSSRDVLRTINEDISKIRERKARRSNSSSETSLERSLERPFDHESTPKASQESRHEPPRFILSVEECSPDLPSHSICVDSGLVMEENDFCHPELHLHHSLQAEDVEEKSINNRRDDKNKCKPDEPLTEIKGRNIINIKNKIDNKSGLTIGPQPAMTSKPTTEPQPVKKSELTIEPHPAMTSKPTMEPQPVKKSEPTIEPQPAMTSEPTIEPHPPMTSKLTIEPSLAIKSKLTIEPQPAIKSEPTIESELLIISEPILSNQDISSRNDSHPKSDYEPDAGLMFVRARIIKVDSNSEIHQPELVSTKFASGVNDSIPINFPLENKEETNQPLEPLLSSQSVSLKTKLQRLSYLYDFDDGEDLKVKKEEPTGPYDVFKAPKKYLHPRSRSAGGVVDSDTEFQQFDVKTRVKSDSDELFGSPSSNDTNTKLTSKTLSIDSLQVSPVGLRKKLRSPGPVLDLVQKFDAHSSDSSSPLVSPTSNSAPSTSSTPQMVKIAERLLQNKTNKSHRYTVDLSRHVREIPKEGAVQRARSIFMDMQST